MDVVTPPYQKRYLDCDVLTASKARITWVFEQFEKVMISFSGGKDSTVLMHLVMEEAIKRNRKVGIFFLDWEIQFSSTIKHVRNMTDLYKEHIDLYWIQLPIKTVNGCSSFEPEWVAWDETRKALWVREKETNSISNPNQLPFYTETMTFEELVPKFSKWYANGKPCAIFIGLRTAESLNRFRSITSDKKKRYMNKPWTTQISETVWNAYPIYDWRTEDDWVYFAKTGKVYPELYELMFKAGLSISQMRVDEPFGVEQRKGLWLYHIIEPDLWAKMVMRIAGANTGGLYAKESGNILGTNTIKLPIGHTWESFAMLLLETMPSTTAEHYKNKISVFLKWYKTRGYPENIPDDLDLRGKEPSWKLICKTLLRNDYWCKGLDFSPTKTIAYQKYLIMAKKRRQAWNILPS
jgi:predicted phosphoadenosine phosphosulfate sulfurtransferase